MAAIGYIRTSTNKQLIDRQVMQLEAECDEVFVEDGVSALQKNRPVYRKLLETLKAGDVLTVISVDRAYRSVIDALTELEKLHARAVEFRSLSQSFDTRTEEGRLFFTIIVALGDWERRILARRTREGMEAARRRGSRIGRPPLLSLAEVNWARRQRSSKSIRILSLQLGVSEPTLRRALKGR